MLLGRPIAVAATWLSAATAVVVMAGCGSADRRNRPVARPMGAPDARDLLERRLGDDPDFGCALIPRLGHVLVIGRSRDLLDEARDLVPRLRGRRTVTVRLDPGTASRTAMRELARRIDAAKPPRLIVYYGVSLYDRRCPRVEIVQTRPAHFNAEERAFAQTMQRRHPGRVVTRLTGPNFAVSGTSTASR